MVVGSDAAPGDVTGAVSAGAGAFGSISVLGVVKGW